MARRSTREASTTASAASTTTTTTTTTTATATTTTTTAATTTSAKSLSKSKSSSSGNVLQDTAVNVWNYYLQTTPQRTMLLDAFMVFLVAVGVVQFVYCVIVSNYPFNAFLSGFSAAVGQFVLTASLRIQTTDANKADFPSVSPERAFADYVVCSLILHFFVINFIN